MNDLAHTVVNKIKAEGIAPKSRLEFLLKRSVFWSLAAAAVLSGALAVSIIVFLFYDHDPSVRAYLNQSAVEDFLITVPYIWLIVLAGLIGVVRYSVRNMKTGYRYGTVKIVSLVLVSSLMGGVLLNALDIGQALEDLLARKVPYYDNLVHTSEDTWSSPGKGLLGGTILSVTGDRAILKDFRGVAWEIYLPAGAKGISAGSLIKMRGKKEGSNGFRADWVARWQD